MATESKLLMHGERAIFLDSFKPLDDHKRMIPGDEKILFVTGKGGVGKSSIAAALALRSAQKGKRTLLVELGEQSFYRDYLSTTFEPSYQPQSYKPHLELARWDADNSLREYVLYYVKSEAIYRVLFENRVSRSLMGAAPALKEIALLGKITSAETKTGPPMEFDLIVVDSFATGHTQALLKTPGALSEIVKFGPMGENSRKIDRVLKDPKRCAYCLVTLADELPVAETLELAEDLKKNLGVSPYIVCNRLLIPPVSRKALGELEKDTSSIPYVQFLKAAWLKQKEYLGRLTQWGCPVWTAPLELESSSGLSLAQRLSQDILPLSETGLADDSSGPTRDGRGELRG